MEGHRLKLCPAAPLEIACSGILTAIAKASHSQSVVWKVKDPFFIKKM